MLLLVGHISGVVADAFASCYRECMSEESTDPTLPAPAPSPPPIGTTYACPNCGQSVFVSPPPIQGIVQCPFCNAQFFCGSNVEDEIVDDSEDSDDYAAPADDAQLDGLKIRQHAALRRSLYRSRSYALIGAGACAVLTVQLGLMAVREFLRNGATVWPVAYVLVAACALYGMVHWTLSATELGREAKVSALNAPTTPPDFEMLGDGSQHVKSLEEIK
jgi:hypothetical protein